MVLGICNTVFPLCLPLIWNQENNIYLNGEINLAQHHPGAYIKYMYLVNFVTLNFMWEPVRLHNWTLQESMLLVLLISLSNSKIRFMFL